MDSAAPMEVNGLSVYNVGASLDLDALTQGSQNNNNHHHDEEDESDDGDEDEIQQSNAEVSVSVARHFIRHYIVG